MESYIDVIYVKEYYDIIDNRISYVHSPSRLPASVANFLVIRNGQYIGWHDTRLLHRIKRECEKYKEAIMSQRPYRNGKTKIT